MRIVALLLVSWSLAVLLSAEAAGQAACGSVVVASGADLVSALSCTSFERLEVRLEHSLDLNSTLNATVAEFAVTTVTGDVVLGGRGAADLFFPNLTSVGGAVSVVACSELIALRLPSLVSIGSYLLLDANDDLVVIELPALASVSDFVGVVDNAALAGLAIPTLVSSGAFVDVSSNDALLTLDFPGLRTINGALTVSRTTTFD